MTLSRKITLYEWGKFEHQKTPSRTSEEKEWVELFFSNKEKKEGEKLAVSRRGKIGAVGEGRQYSNLHDKSPRRGGRKKKRKANGVRQYCRGKINPLPRRDIEGGGRKVGRKEGRRCRPSSRKRRKEERKPSDLTRCRKKRRTTATCRQVTGKKSGKEKAACASLSSSAKEREEKRGGVP